MNNSVYFVLFISRIKKKYEKRICFQKKIITFEATFLEYIY